MVEVNKALVANTVQAQSCLHVRCTRGWRLMGRHVPSDLSRVFSSPGSLDSYILVHISSAGNRTDPLNAQRQSTRSSNEL